MFGLAALPFVILLWLLCRTFLMDAAVVVAMACGTVFVFLAMTFDAGKQMTLGETAPATQMTTSAARPPSARVRPPMKYRYVGTKKCKMCHYQWHESWKARPHGRAFEALRPGVSRPVKNRVGLDSNKDYTAEAKCLGCHSVGYGRPGGYVIPNPSDGKSLRLAAVREAVGCESCLGPGSGFVKIMKAIDRDHRMYEIEELFAAGYYHRRSEVCLSCHDQRAPCISPGYRFDDNELKGRSFHKSFKLKYRRW